MFGQQSNNQQQGTGFGGFGTNSNTGSGFGQTQNTGFGGTPNTSGSLFGATNTGFGASGSTFGTTGSNSTPFGANKPAFGTGATSSGGLFSTTPSASTSTFGGFGGNNTGNTSGGLFGAANKPAFGGTQGSSGGGLFGSGSGFGSQSNQATSTFGAPLSSALGPNSAECQGTGSTPFQAFTEKEGTGTQMNHFQSISFMGPYKNFSFEELRLADYNQGRRFGNGSGQAGAFGATGFGGFGGQQQNSTAPFGGQQPAGSLFGSQSSGASPFGGTQTASSGFGGGGPFGQKPATTSLFGGTPASTSQTSGSLFGTSGQSGFGGAQNTGTGFGGGSLFGGNAQQQQKPTSGFSFGGTNTTSGFGGSGTGFGTGGTSNTTGGGLFGTNSTTSAFGGQQQQQTATSNPFGNFGSTQQNPNQPSTGTAFGGFGGQQSKPGGLFGGNNSAPNNAGGGLFNTNTQSNTQQQPSTTGLFGGNQPTTNSLFGAPKPAGTGTSLFGTGANTTNSNPSNLFGNLGGNNNQQPQNNPSTGLFGQTVQSQKPGGLFSSTGTTTGGGLFSGSTNNNTQQPAGGSLFGNLGSNNQQQQSSSLFGNTNNASSSLFNNSQQPQNALQPPQAMTTSLIDRYPYGSASIFDGLPPPPQANPGPLATPINTGNKMKKSAILPQYKINPNTASRLVTPQKRGYGFSYSTYGTPSSVSSNVSTPGGFGSSLLYGSIGRGLGKSLSTSNLRRTFDSDRESILSPGAFSAGSSRSSASHSGSLKKLTIDRTLRTDLFLNNQGAAALPNSEKYDQSRQPSILKKKVSFDANTVGGNGAKQDAEVNGINGSATGDSHNSATPSAQEQGFLRSSSRTNGRLNGSRANGTPSQPEMEQLKGNELAIVHEDGSPEAPTTSEVRPQSQIPPVDPEPGAYYIIPSRQELSKMPKQQLKSMKGFCIGREGCGRVVFDEPVDLTTVELDNISGNIAVIETRSLTVYPEQDKKPSLGKGLNVPSTIYLENSWPRQKDRRTSSHEKSGPRFQKHVDRLRKVTGTEFVRYEKDTGTWVFKVPHFTTYALDYDDTASEGDTLHTSRLSEPPDTPTPQSRTPKNGYMTTPVASAQGSSFLSEEQSNTSSSPDDTFEFRTKKVIPGNFEDTAAFEDDLDMEEVTYQDETFLDERLPASPSDSGEDEPSDIKNAADDVQDRSLVVHDEDLEMAGSFPHPDGEDLDVFNVPGKPRSIMKSPHQESVGFDTLGKLRFHGSDEWAEQLQGTISPRKQDRQALRDSQAYVMKDRGPIHEGTPKANTAVNGAGQVLVTSIDLMNSLFGQDQARRSGSGAKQVKKGKGFEWPYAKQSNIDEDDMSEMDRGYHESYKPSWGPGATLLYAMPSKFKLSQRKSTQTNAVINDQKELFVSEGRDIRFAKFASTPELVPETLKKQRNTTKIVLDREVPMAKVQRVPMKDVASMFEQKSDHERNIWELAYTLFDGLDSEVPASDLNADTEDFYNRVRKDRFSKFWEEVCQDSASKAVAAAPNAEERAIAHLSANKVVEACDALAQGKDFRLAILVAQLGGDHVMREDMALQIQKWRNLNILSEMTEPIRTLYGLLAGNTCICEGKKGPLEDRARTFTVSDRFDLDWKRAFALRFWYAILTEERIEAAVKNFAEDLTNDESRKPSPWFIEQGADRPWEDPAGPQREDLLWGLLKLYASSKGALPSVSIADILLPHNTTGNPLDVRLSFQLYHALAIRFPNSADPAKADHLACDFAAQLSAAGEWLWALFALLHLSDSEKRKLAIQSILARHAAEIPVDGPDSRVFRTLTEEFQIPAPWIWEAKALYARAVLQDHAREVQYLLEAGNWNEAHTTLVRAVAPRCVIEQDYTMLQSLLDGFAIGQKMVGEWGMGGQVYTDFLALIKGIEGKEKEAAVGRLVCALPALGRGQRGLGDQGFREGVAVKEMGRVVASVVAEAGVRGIETANILQLPLTRDQYSKHTVELGLQYYRNLMGAER